MTLVIVDTESDAELAPKGATVMTARAYLEDAELGQRPRLRLINLCRSVRYQSLGYYVSLLAEARDHRPLPRVTTMQDLTSLPLARAAVALDARDLKDLLAGHAAAELVLEIAFGESRDGRFSDLARRFFEALPAPYLKARLLRRSSGRWVLDELRAGRLASLDAEGRRWLSDALARFLRSSHPRRRSKAPASFDIGILVNKEEPDPPSDAEALEAFARAAERQGMAPTFLEREDAARISTLDALFIRATTRVDDMTYRFSRRAASEGLIVIDDPRSILRCGNKVYLAEALARAGIAAPETRILQRPGARESAIELGLPLVLKRPDGAFSQGVEKVSTPGELDAALHRLFETSELLVAQRFTPTDFDWRVGVLAGRPLYVCKYHMAPAHWQIIKREDGSSAPLEGDVETLSPGQAPPEVIAAALAAARLMGDGLYGVDLKVIDGEALVIEVNDNPSIDSGYEDALLGEALYDAIMEHFFERLQRQRALRREGGS